MIIGNQQDGSNLNNENDLSGIAALLQELIIETRAMRVAIVSIACQDNKVVPKDFEPQNFTMIDEEESE